MTPSSPKKRRPRKADVAQYCARSGKNRAVLEAAAVVAVRRLCRSAVARLREVEAAAA